MRCTNCSNKVTPVVALDIDGTLGQYHSHFVDFLQHWLGPSYPWSPSRNWDGYGEFSDHLEIEKHIYQQAKLAFRQGGFKRWMPTFTGASSLAASLRANGAEVWITTTRPWLSLDSVDPDTRHWLARVGVSYDHLLFGEDKYGDLAERVDPERVMLVLEDEADNIIRCHELDLPVVGRITQWNSKAVRDSAYHTVRHLHQAAQLFTDRKGTRDALGI